MEGSEGWYIAAIIFTVLNCCIICGGCIYPMVLLWILTQIGSGGYPAPNQDEREKENQTWLIIYCLTILCLILPGLIACNVIMWMMYEGTLQFENNETVFWIVSAAATGFGLSLLTCCCVRLFRVTFDSL